MKCAPTEAPAHIDTAAGVTAAAVVNAATTAEAIHETADAMIATATAVTTAGTAAGMIAGMTAGATTTGVVAMAARTGEAGRGPSGHPSRSQSRSRSWIQLA